MSMNVEIINVGTELLLGEIVNTNATVLQKVCRDLGFNVYYQTVVGDNFKRLYECLELAFQRGADCVMTTGGLGPTSDDLTKELSAQYLGLQMVYHHQEAQKIYKKCCFIMDVNEIPENNLKQAYFPEDAYILDNLMGTANGCIMKNDEKMIINLPGPPKELQHVLEYSLLPYLQKFKQDTIYTYEYTTMFIGESRLDEVLRDLIDHQQDVSIALYAGEQTVRVRLAVKTQSLEQADVMMHPIKKEIEKRIGKYILWQNDLKTALLTLGKTIYFQFQSDFVIKDHGLDQIISLNPDVMISVDIEKKELGEVVTFTFNDDYSFRVPTFMKAKYSYQKVEARFIAQLYDYMLNRL